jgi:SAM-dependent methyltransferase
MVDGPLSWSYGSIVLVQIRHAKALLDIGTGGGELLASFRPLPAITCATESYRPNISVAKRKLEPLGVRVFRTKKEEGPLPFQDATFDVVIDRHASYIPSEVFRVLKSGGLFTTQQVGDSNEHRIRKMLGAEEFLPPRWNLRFASRQLRRAGFRIDFEREEYPSRRFYDVGAIVYYLKAVPWVIPDFSIRKYFKALILLNREIGLKGYVEVRNHRFVVVGQKR